MSTTACTATRRDGTPCRATPTASGKCFAHDEKLRQKTADGRRRGGHNKATAARATKLPADLRDLASQLMAAITECYNGELEPRRLSAMGTAAGVVVRVHEATEVTQRLDALEAAADNRGINRGPIAVRPRMPS